MEGFGSWSVLTADFLIVLYIALNGVTLAAILHLVNGKWREQVRFLSVSTFALMPVAFVLLIVLLLNPESTFQWMSPSFGSGHGGHADAAHHLNGWHNYTFLVIRQISAFLLMATLYGLFIKYQHLATVDKSYAVQRKFRNIALLIPFGYVLYATMMAWDFEMTMIPNWHSASYGAYHFVSNFHFYIAFMIIFLFILRKSGALTKEIPDYVMNFLAQIMLAFTIIWTYLFFTQYLIMWYGRLPEEIVRFRNMMDNGLGVVWWTFVALKFVIPLSSLIFAFTRHTPAAMVVVATGICVGTWLERYTWISGSVDPEFYHRPMTAGFDVVVTAIVAVVAIIAMRWSLRKYGLVRS